MIELGIEIREKTEITQITKEGDKFLIEGIKGQLTNRSKCDMVVSSNNLDIHRLLQSSKVKIPEPLLPLKANHRLQVFVEYDITDLPPEANLRFKGGHYTYSATNLPDAEKGLPFDGTMFDVINTRKR